MSLYGEFQDEVNNILNILRDAYDEISNASNSTNALMDMVHSNIDDAPSNHVGEVKAGISDVRQSFANALTALGEAHAAIRKLMN